MLFSIMRTVTADSLHITTHSLKAASHLSWSVEWSRQIVACNMGKAGGVLRKQLQLVILFMASVY